MQYKPNEAVITTQSVIDGASIVRVFSNTEDDFWEFYPDDDWEQNDLRLIGMFEIVKKDSRLLDLITRMNEREFSYFDKTKRKWITVPDSDNDKILQ